MPKKGAKKSQRRVPRRQVEGPNNIPTLPANPRHRLTIALVNEVADGLPFHGNITYKQLMAAAARQIKTGLPTPIALPDEEEWAERFRAIYNWLEVSSAAAWGTPYVNTDKGSSTRFDFTLLPRDPGLVQAPQPTKIDSAAGASDRPFGRQRGGKAYFTSAVATDAVAAVVTSVDTIHFHVLLH